MDHYSKSNITITTAPKANLTEIYQSPRETLRIWWILKNLYHDEIEVFSSGSKSTGFAVPVDGIVISEV